MNTKHLKTVFVPCCLKFKPLSTTLNSREASKSHAHPARNAALKHLGNGSQDWQRHLETLSQRHDHSCCSDALCHLQLDTKHLALGQPPLDSSGSPEQGHQVRTSQFHCEIVGTMILSAAGSKRPGLSWYGFSSMDCIRYLLCAILSKGQEQVLGVHLWLLPRLSFNTLFD